MVFPPHGHRPSGGLRGLGRWTAHGQPGATANGNDVTQQRIHGEAASVGAENLKRVPRALRGEAARPGAADLVQEPQEAG